ncbi:uncharacterized protein GIQ15_03608 [Arthroderma uncinatum]|uniref:uncharacterized protein n=1 Tax=Arthroderma uncinatum TaxID=74035 RepID=UPI00144A9CA3|nr:uncharacterized protein GIQ15_03608 [Arthroderma uncinatum]KAF3484284.1 hypothetical protein GIQ15_03608 [Arthroderma uncinatum]
MSFHGSFFRGRGRGRGSSWRGGAKGVEASAPPKPLGPAIDSINIKTLLIEEVAPKIKDFEYIASYNWLDGKSPTILVPGSPPAWTPPAADPKLKPDSEEVFRDINAARYALYPMEPIFRSLRALKPEYDLQSTDIVGCGSTFGNLMRFARSESRPFRFDVDVIGDTVLFVRRESSPTEVIADLQGYGHTFPDAYTTWDMEVRNSCSHQRIVRYDFGGLKFLVRTETDGYVKLSGTDAPSRPSEPANESSVAEALESMFVASGELARDQKLKLKIKGTLIPQQQIFDIKTRASYKSFDMNEILPRLWLNQTPKFLIAYHTSGLFDHPEVKDVRQDVIRWENDNSAILARFHALVSRIVDVVRDSESKQCEASWDGQGPLLITEQIGEARRALPPDLIQLFGFP